MKQCLPSYVYRLYEENKLEGQCRELFYQSMITLLLNFVLESCKGYSVKLVICYSDYTEGGLINSIT